MTNAEIILGAMMLAEIDPMEVEVDTFAGWKRKGYVVKRGEKAVFQTKIWKPCKFVKKDDEEQQTDEQTEEKKNYKKLMLVNASFFTDLQVERITK